MKRIILIEEDDDKQCTGFQPPQVPLYPFNTYEDPCANCNVRQNPFWDGICHCTIPYKNRVIC